ncbi:MAG: TlpA family protein disulfide reductase [Candidatus Methylomirabilia bacterium]
MIMTATGKLPAAALTLCVLLLGGIARPGDAAAIKEGDPFPHFSGTDLNGVAVDTKAFAKKLLLIDFWSVYCSSCIQEMPHIVDLYAKYKDQGLQCVGIDLDPMMPAAKVRKFLEGQNFPMPYPNVQDSKRQIMKLLGVSMLPTTILVDPAGVVLLFHVGYKPGFEKDLAEIVKKYLPVKGPTHENHAP